MSRNALANVPGVRVAARTSSFAFKGEKADIAEVAQRLKVGTVVEGSVRRAGGRIKVTAQLINAANGFHLWSNTYERAVPMFSRFRKRLRVPLWTRCGSSWTTSQRPLPHARVICVRTSCTSSDATSGAGDLKRHY
ncbi:MAG: hypothetical protein ACT443_02915 [Gemmatimonadota bacterium]